MTNGDSTVTGLQGNMISYKNKKAEIYHRYVFLTAFLQFCLLLK